MNAEPEGAPTALERWLKAGAILIWSFWAVFSLVTPVTNFDANTYNLARLELAWKGGLFGNPYWNSDPQICWPWTFDAVHLPFLWIGFGASLPSFACFTGVLVITYRLVAARFGRLAGWGCCCSLLSLPTLVYQATSTKNDVAVVFAAAAWYYALDRFRNNGRRRNLLLMALSLGFAAGSKTSGLPLAAILSAYSFWTLRRSARAPLVFGAGLAAGLVLWGSAEIYLNNLRVFGRLLGSDSFIHSLRNPDGVRGMFANFIRYLFGNTNIGVDSVNPQTPFVGWTERVCRSVLSFLGCANAGNEPGVSDARMLFQKNGGEGASDFGIVGGAALWFSIVALFLFRRKDAVWKLSALSVASLLLVCRATAWMLWHNRYLLLPFSLTTIALALAVFRSRSRLARAALVAGMLFSGVAAPWFTPNENPAGLWASIARRRAFTFLERPTMQEVVDDLDARVRSGEVTGIALCARSDAWILPFFTIRGLEVTPVPNPEAAFDYRLNGRERYVLAVGTASSAGHPLGLQVVKAYSEPNSALYLLHRAE